MMRRRSRCWRFSALLILLMLGAAGAVPAQEPVDLLDQAPAAESSTGEATDPAEKALDDLSTPVKIALLLTALTVLPAILMTVTSFTRIIIVLSFVRKALGVTEMPPNQVTIGLALFLTVVVMQPVLGEVNDQALQPYLAEEIGLTAAFEKTAGSFSRFLRSQTDEADLVMMVEISRIEPPETPEDAPLHVLVPAFALSELRTAFQMGFIVYLPFLIVDLVVSSVLLSMGMFMLPPVIISTPFKILLFVLVDGWDLVVRSVISSFQT